jgi:hypothetical protein
MGLLAGLSIDAARDVPLVEFERRSRKLIILLMVAAFGSNLALLPAQSGTFRSTGSLQLEVPPRLDVGATHPAGCLGIAARSRLGDSFNIQPGIQGVRQPVLEPGPGTRRDRSGHPYHRIWTGRRFFQQRSNEDAVNASGNLRKTTAQHHPRHLGFREGRPT